MSTISKVSIGFAFCTGVLCLLSQQMTGEEPRTTSEASTSSQLVLKSEPSQRPPSVDSAPGVTESFADMRDALTVARQRAGEIECYTATLEMQEEVNGRLKALANIKIKLRRQPFSVYMKWDGNGQEALFVDGQNGGRLLAKPANGLAAIKRLWRLNPESRMAKQGCRHPITASGLENLVNRVHDFYSGRDDWSSAAACTASESVEVDSVFTVYDLQFKNQEVSPLYVSSRLSFEKSSGLLLRVQNFGWTDETAPRLLEHYAYRLIDSSSRLKDHDFDEKNSDYEFVER